MKKMYRLWRGTKIATKSSRNRRQERAPGIRRNACDVQPAAFTNKNFVQLSTVAGTTVRFLNVVDECTRHFLTIKVTRSITSEDAIDTLAELFSMYGVLKRLRSDNGPEFIAKAIRDWLNQIGVKVLYIEPGSPWQNGLCESFNSRLRDEYLHQTELLGLADARLKARVWREDFNDVLPRSSLGYLPPSEFSRRCAASAPVAALQLHSDTPLLAS